MTTAGDSAENPRGEADLFDTAYSSLVETTDPWAPWTFTHKGDARGRRLADRHYTRQKPGNPRWTRPGYSFVMYAQSGDTRAVFVWWRPKYEGGVERKDDLRVLECTIFRLDGGAFKASDLVKAAVQALRSRAAARELHGEKWTRLPLITGVGSKQTARRRSKHKLPGVCFREAGFVDFDKDEGKTEAQKKRRARGRTADVWLRHPGIAVDAEIDRIFGGAA